MLPTTVVGSFPQPEWLVHRDALLSGGVPRVPRPNLWRVPEEMRDQAHDDATRLVVRDMERAGVDIVSDGEVRRESYFSWLAPALTGLDVAKPGSAISRTGRPTPVPRAIGPITRPKPVLARHTAFLRAETDHPIKITVPGPFTLTALTQNEYYPDAPSLALAYAAVVNAELRDLKAAGADFVQLDEPYLQARAEKAARFAIPAINRALDGIEGTTALHTCFGYAHIVHNRPKGYPFLEELADTKARQISMESAQQNVDLGVLKSLAGKQLIVGVLDLADNSAVEHVDTVVNRIKNALRYVDPERLIVAPDCGMKYLPRDKAFGKLSVLAAAAARVREEL